MTKKDYNILFLLLIFALLVGGYAFYDVFYLKADNWVSYILVFALSLIFIVMCIHIILDVLILKFPSSTKLKYLKEKWNKVGDYILDSLSNL